MAQNCTGSAKSSKWEATSASHETNSMGVINAGAPATLRFLQQHCLQVAGVVSTVAFDLDAAKVVCADAVLRHRAE